MTDVKKILAAVREHAERHYEDGWDSIVECFDDDDELIDVIMIGRDEFPKTESAAIKAVGKFLGIRAERYDELRKVCFGPDGEW